VAKAVALGAASYGAKKALEAATTRRQRAVTGTALMQRNKKLGTPGTAGYKAKKALQDLM